MGAGGIPTRRGLAGGVKIPGEDVQGPGGMSKGETSLCRTNGRVDCLLLTCRAGQVAAIHSHEMRTMRTMQLKRQRPKLDEVVSDLDFFPHIEQYRASADRTVRRLLAMSVCTN